MCRKPDNIVDKSKAFRLRDYQTEVLNKCEGRPAGFDHPGKAMFYRIGLEVPEAVIMQALGDMQDARLQNMNFGIDNYIYDLTRYYLACVRERCREQRIETTIRWSGK